MDIASIVSSDPSQFLTFAAERQQQEAEISRFQALLEQALESQRSGVPTIDREELRQATKVFESYFIQMMFREMRRTSLNENGFIPKSNAERIFTDMLDEEISNITAARGGIGLAEMMYQQMTRHLN